jgi:hypothetical protein
MIVLSTEDGQIAIDVVPGTDLDNLPLDTRVTLPTGDSLPFGQWATLSNGDCYRILEEATIL